MRVLPNESNVVLCRCYAVVDSGVLAPHFTTKAPERPAFVRVCTAARKLVDSFTDHYLSVCKAANTFRSPTALVNPNAIPMSDTVPAVRQRATRLHDNFKTADTFTFAHRDSARATNPADRLDLRKHKRQLLLPNLFSVSSQYTVR